VKAIQTANQNYFLAGIKPGDFALISSKLELRTLKAGHVLFEASENVETVCFPLPDTIASLVLDLRDGNSAESMIVGREGAIGGIVSAGHKPAFARGVIHMGGPVLMLRTTALERAKRQSSTLRDFLERYADCILAQVLQSVACNALHDFDARLARWLLMIHDRSSGDQLHVTQELVAQMLGVHRSYVSSVLGRLERHGAIRRSRGMVTVINRRRIEKQACECYAYVQRHFQRLLPKIAKG
jgi:CRP-like cAMP-binding protein